MLTGVHFILTYRCNFECDHCFLSCGPQTRGTFTLDQIKAVIHELRALGTVTHVGFEGGEPFLFHPLLCASVALAAAAGFNTSVQTNCYWATSESDAALWLAPLKSAGLSTLEVSDDSFHHGPEEPSRASRALAAAEKIGLAVNSICIQPPAVQQASGHARGDPIYMGGPKLRGRAVARLVDGLPRRACGNFVACPFEDLVNPRRVHVDAFGHVHLCQGLSMGNMWQTPLADLVRHYDAVEHPVSGPIARGGPVALAEQYQVAHAATYVDACHMCSHVCQCLLDRFPQFLAPRQVYAPDSADPPARTASGGRDRHGPATGGEARARKGDPA